MRYLVILSGVLPVEAVTTIEAADEEEARRKALDTSGDLEYRPLDAVDVRAVAVHPLERS